MCGNCAGDHPTSHCMLKPQNLSQQQPRMDKWCDFEQKWTNHDTQDCWHRIIFMREQRLTQMPNYGNLKGFSNPNFPMGGERAMPILGQQPPLLGNVDVWLVHIDEEQNQTSLTLSCGWAHMSLAPPSFAPFIIIMKIMSPSPHGYPTILMFLGIWSFTNGALVSLSCSRFHSYLHF